tara:strand:+ start:65 stop:316 length:252 start_codon:yes stop_codon:yes gene_type:complete
MEKSRKKTKKGYSKPVVDSIPTPTPTRRMINRKAIQAELDIDKDIRRLLDVDYYNDNQIASMIRGADLARVKKVKDERRKTNT